MFKHQLDKKNTYKLDKGDVYGSVLALPRQIASLWEETKSIKMTKGCRLVDNVVVVGMGGSALGARVIEAIGRDRLSLPMVIVNDYHLPAYVDERSLVILSSYSGGTEEILAAAEEALSKKAQVVVLTMGGKLAEIAQKNQWSLLKLSEGDNPSNQPRMAIGMNVMACLRILERCGHIEVEDKEVIEVVEILKKQQRGLVIESGFKENVAKQLATKIKNKGVILVAGEHLTGAVHVFKNQLNENAKTFSVRFDLPELNHHLLEGLGFPKSLRENMHFVLFDSEIYSVKIRKRLALTEEVIVKQGYSITKIKPEARGILGQVWETIFFGEFVSFYLAMLYKIDPQPIPWVDYFKQKLEE